MHLVCGHLVYRIRNTSTRSPESKTPFHVSWQDFGRGLLPMAGTNIDILFAVAEKLKQEGRQEIFQNETMEEMEDEEGNVYNRKTYEDLKKQGII